jgi:hypothetical protein
MLAAGHRPAAKGHTREAAPCSCHVRTLANRAYGGTHSRTAAGSCSGRYEETLSQLTPSTPRGQPATARPGPASPGLGSAAQRSSQCCFPTHHVHTPVGSNQGGSVLGAVLPKTMAKQAHRGAQASLPHWRLLGLKQCSRPPQQGLTTRSAARHPRCCLWLASAANMWNTEVPRTRQRYWGTGARRATYRHS